MKTILECVIIRMFFNELEHKVFNRINNLNFNKIEEFQKFKCILTKIHITN